MCRIQYHDLFEKRAGMYHGTMMDKKKRFISRNKPLRLVLYEYLKAVTYVLAEPLM
jgi:hypothetical protein